MRRRGEIRVAVLEEKACVERAGENVEEVWRKKNKKTQTPQSCSESRRKREWRRGGESRRLAEESSRAHVP